MAPVSAAPAHPALTAAAYSFVAGYVDTVGYVALFGLFTAHVTGNFVLIGASLAQSHGGLIAKLAALPVFIVTVMLTTSWVQSRMQAGRPAARGVLLAQIVCLSVFAAIGIVSAPITTADAPAAIAAGLFGVMAMAIQNTASRLLMSELPPTTVMTGSVTQVAIDLARWRTLAAGPERVKVRTSLGKFAGPIAAFAVGAIAGAVLLVFIGFAALVVPITLLVLMLFGLYRGSGSSESR